MKIYLQLTILSFLFVCQAQIVYGGLIDNWIFSKKSYAEYIEIEGYIHTKQKVVDFFSAEKMSEIKLVSYDEISKVSKDDEKIYLFVRLRNNGNQSAWGVLDVIFNNRKVKICINFIQGHSKWSQYVIPLEAMAWPENNRIPNLSFSWESLYAK